MKHRDTYFFTALTGLIATIGLYSYVQNYDAPNFPTDPSATWTKDEVEAYTENTIHRIEQDATPEDYANNEYICNERELDALDAKLATTPEDAHNEYFSLKAHQFELSNRQQELGDSLKNAYVANHPDVLHIKQVQADKAKYYKQIDSLEKIPKEQRLKSNWNLIKAKMFAKTK